MNYKTANLHIVFWYRKNQIDESRQGTIMCRLHLQNGQKTKNFSTKIRVFKKDWNIKTKKILGGSEEAERANEKLKIIQRDLQNIELECRKREIKILPEKIIFFYKNGFSEEKTAKMAFEEYIKIKKNYRKINGKKLSEKTIKRYEDYKNYFIEFIKFKKQPNILLSDLNRDFGLQFFDWLRFDRKSPISHNTAVKTVYFLSGMLTMAVGKEWVYQKKLKSLNLKKIPKSDFIFLTDDELFAWESQGFARENLQISADMYCMQCYTGLAYIDLAYFDFEKDVFSSTDGTMFIKGNRQKTENQFVIPLSHKAIKLFEKYGNEIPKIRYKGEKKVLSLKSYNDNLLEIAKFVGIKKHITSHTARCTAAMRWYNLNYPDRIIESMMGSSIQMIKRHYAKIQSDTIVRTFKELESSEIYANSI